MEKVMLELLAHYEHERWSKWQKYLHSICIKNEDGSITIPLEKVERWERQMNTVYEFLPEKEKDSDRSGARQILKILEENHYE